MKLWTTQLFYDYHYEIGTISDEALKVLRDTHHMRLEQGRIRLYPSNPFLQKQLWEFY